jgi:hypothetical protein
MLALLKRHSERLAFGREESLYFACLLVSLILGMRLTAQSPSIPQPPPAYLTTAIILRSKATKDPCISFVR